MVKVHFGIGIRIVSLFYAIYAVNMSVFRVWVASSHCTLLFYEKYAENRDAL